MSHLQMDYIEAQHFSNGTSVLVNNKNEIILAQRLPLDDGRFKLRMLENLSTGENLVKKRKVSEKPKPFVFDPEQLEWSIAGTATKKDGTYKNPKGPFYNTSGSNNPEQFEALKKFIDGKFKYRYSGTTLWGYWCFGEIISRRDYTKKK
jgi:hypothetical protein